jgi:hypothetical protein
VDHPEWELEVTFDLTAGLADRYLELSIMAADRTSHHVKLGHCRIPLRTLISSGAHDGWWTLRDVQSGELNIVSFHTTPAAAAAAAAPPPRCYSALAECRTHFESQGETFDDCGMLVQPQHLQRYRSLREYDLCREARQALRWVDLLQQEQQPQGQPQEQPPQEEEEEEEEQQQQCLRGGALHLRAQELAWGGVPQSQRERIYMQVNTNRTARTGRERNRCHAASTH